MFLSVREGLQLTYLDVVVSTQSVRMHGERGQQIPLHATSQGKVILAFLPPGVGERIIDQLDFPRYTESTVTSSVELHEAMYEIRREGYALNLEEREVGVRSVAAPVLDPEGNVVASVCVGGPSFRITEKDLRGRLADLVTATAEEISAELIAAASLTHPPTTGQRSERPDVAHDRADGDRGDRGAQRDDRYGHDRGICRADRGPQPDSRGRRVRRAHTIRQTRRARTPGRGLHPDGPDETCCTGRGVDEIPAYLVGPAFVGTTVTASVTCTHLDMVSRRATFTTTVVDDATTTKLISGTAVVAFPKGENR